jgi:hypothetical protein
MAFTIKKGDTLPALNATLRTSTGGGAATAADLTAATAVILVIKNQSGGAAERLTAAFVSKPDGTVTYDWQLGDTDTAGTYDCEWEVAFGSDIQTFPNSGYFTIVIETDLV